MSCKTFSTAQALSNSIFSIIALADKDLLKLTKGRFNNYVTLKLPFLTHLPPTITLCHVCSRDPSCVTSGSAQTPPIPNKKTKF